jgi:hypothetical protein
MAGRIVELLLEEGDSAWEGASALLQAGFLLESRPGPSAREFMREALGLEDGYIERTVSTVFIDYAPVDDIDAARLKEGSLIALSAAMPGLVGAVMRRKSPYASFREAISYSRREAEGPAPSTAGAVGPILVRVKLFNSVMRDRGPAILAKGVLVEEEAAAALLAGRPEALGGAVAAAEGTALIRLRVRARSGGGA